LYLNVGSGLSSRVRRSEETSMRTDSPSTTVPRAWRARRVLLAAGTVVAAWVALGAPIHLGMLTIPTP
jgi:hypothetical protein